MVAQQAASNLNPVVTQPSELSPRLQPSVGGSSASLLGQLEPHSFGTRAGFTFNAATSVERLPSRKLDIAQRVVMPEKIHEAHDSDSIEKKLQEMSTVQAEAKRDLETMATLRSRARQASSES